MISTKEENNHKADRKYNGRYNFTQSGQQRWHLNKEMQERRKDTVQIDGRIGIPGRGNS